MASEVEGLLAADGRYRVLLQALLEHPFTERKDLAACCGLKAEDVEALMPAVLDKWVVIELTSQADSSLESRVPKRVYMVNPEMEEEVRRALGS